MALCVVLGRRDGLRAIDNKLTVPMRDLVRARLVAVLGLRPAGLRRNPDEAAITPACKCGVCG